MSHTDKDLPNWVRLNNEGTRTNHNHFIFGRKYYRTRYVLDERGNKIYEDVPVYREATYILRGWAFSNFDTPYYHQDWRARPIFTGTVRKRAQELHSAGRGKELVEVWTGRQAKTERYVFTENYDFCTEGMKLSDKDWYAGRSDSHHMGLPCTPDFPAGQGWWKYGSTTQRAYEHERYFTTQRTASRDHMKNLTKAWNSGDDLEDWDEDIVLNGETSSYIFW